MPNPRRWPDTLWVVRHGESAGNVARDAADAAGLPVIDIVGRDVDVPLSAAGEEQAAALGRWFASMRESERPNVVLTSTYRRARDTGSIIIKSGGVAEHAPLSVDERLREKEFGILDRLTRLGIQQRFPEQAQMRTLLGKFYHRPPGGESWCDVILRLRSALDTISLHHSRPGTRVLVVAHQVVVLCMRYLIEGLTEEEILTIDREGDVANCGVTTYALDERAQDDGAEPRLRLITYNFVAPLEAAGAPVTSEPDAPVAAR
jgi:broad specificity phosphatase PhoE